MQFSCNSCQARYKIEDDKVRGKILRVRCKRCSNTIVLQEPPAEEAIVPRDEDATHVVRSADVKRSIAEQTRSEPPKPDPDPPQWYVAIAGEEAGPFREADVRRRIEAGQLNLRSYVWRDGMEGWARLKDVPALAQYIKAPRPPPPPLLTDELAVPPTLEKTEVTTPLTQLFDRPSERETTQPTPLSIPSVSTPIEITSPTRIEATPRPMTSTESFPAPSFELGEQTRAIFRESATKKRSRSSTVAASLIGACILATTLVLVWWMFRSPHLPSVSATASAATPRPSPKPAAEPSATQPSPISASVAPTPPPATHGVVQAIVQQKLNEIQPHMRDCINTALKKEPKLRIGALTITTQIEPSGAMGKIAFSRANLGESELGKCLRKTIQGMHFASFEGQPQELSIPLSVGLAL